MASVEVVAGLWPSFVQKVENDLGTEQLQLIAQKEIRDTIFTHLHEQR